MFLISIRTFKRLLVREKEITMTFQFLLPWRHLAWSYKLWILTPNFPYPTLCCANISTIKLGTDNLELQFGVNSENYSEYFDSFYIIFFSSYRMWVWLPLFWNINKGYYIFVLKSHLYYRTTVCEGTCIHGWLFHFFGYFYLCLKFLIATSCEKVHGQSLEYHF